MKPRDGTRQGDKPDYGIDSPYVVRNLFIIGVAAVTAGLLVPPFDAWGFRVSLVSPTHRSADDIKAELRLRHPGLSHVTVEVAVCEECTT